VRLSTDILFFQYVQWVAAEQWQTARRQMEGVEIFGDCPFMVTLDSADVWSRRQDFILDASVGTPADAFSETGQEWGLPPYNWDMARTNDFEWLRMRARRLAELYDGFRVDHLVGFYRTYVRPLDGRPPYFMPADEADQRELGETVMRIMIDTGADVSVEDLGTVPPFVRESIAKLGLPGYRVLELTRRRLGGARPGCERRERALPRESYGRGIEGRRYDPVREHGPCRVEILGKADESERAPVRAHAVLKLASGPGHRSPRLRAGEGFRAVLGSDQHDLFDPGR
jgi:4-alpha-glucanotransferase